MKRSYGNIISFNGLMQIDLDGIETVNEAKQIKSHIFENYKQIVCAFLSPSGKGVKCLMKTIPFKTIAHYKGLHQGMVNTFEEYTYLDESTNNAILPMFLSSDPDILWRDFSECEAWDYVDYTKPKYVNLNNGPTNFIPNTNGIYNKGEQYLMDKVVRIITTRIENVLDNGHPQVRSTSLVLGSRVAAGYIHVGDAENLIISLISKNEYLSKNINGYNKTALWCIKEGMKSPKYF